MRPEGSASAVLVKKKEKAAWKIHVIIIIIAFKLKAQFEICYNLLDAPQTVSNMYSQVAKAQLYENHVQHTERLSHVTCCMPLGTKGQLSY